MQQLPVLKQDLKRVKRLYELVGKAGDIMNSQYHEFNIKGKLVIYIYGHVADDETNTATITNNINVGLNNNKVSKSTFGAMSISKFGSTTSGFLIFLILLLILAGVLYFLHSKGKVKIPGLPQRIAAFGRQIKAIRKM